MYDESSMDEFERFAQPNISYRCYNRYYNHHNNIITVKFIELFINNTVNYSNFKATLGLHKYDYFNNVFLVVTGSGSAERVPKRSMLATIKIGILGLT